MVDAEDQFDDSVDIDSTEEDESIEDKKNIQESDSSADMATYCFLIIFLFIGYLGICFLSWIGMNIAVEWGYVYKFPLEVFAPLNETGNKLVDAYYLINKPRFWFLELYSAYKFTTITVSIVIGMILWGVASESY